MLVKGAEAHERRRHGNVRTMRERREILRRASRNHATAGIEHRTLRLVDQLRETVDLRRRRRGLRMIRPKRDALGILSRRQRLLAVLRDVDHDRTRLAVRRNVKGLGHRLRNLIGGLHEETVLGNPTGNARRVGLLEGIRTNEGQRHLTGDDDHRDTVHIRRRQTRNGIGRARTGRHKTDARLARCTRITIGHVRRTLLVTPKYELELGLREAVENV